MSSSSPVRSQPIAVSASVEAQVYGLFALACALTFVGVFIGMQFAVPLLTSGFAFVLLIAELVIIFTSRWWMEKRPLNYILFALFPIFSGITLTPYLLYILAGYANGASILLNAFAATTFMSLAAAVFARTTRFNLASLGPALMTGLVGLIVLGVLQVIFPGLRTGTTELIVSGLGVVIFAMFLAFDLQRIRAMGRVGANPFMLALSLYLDIFNLFLYVVRLMLAVSGRRR